MIVELLRTHKHMPHDASMRTLVVVSITRATSLFLALKTNCGALVFGYIPADLFREIGLHFGSLANEALQLDLQIGTCLAARLLVLEVICLL